MKKLVLILTLSILFAACNARLRRANYKTEKNRNNSISHKVRSPQEDFIVKWAKKLKKGNKKVLYVKNQKIRVDCSNYVKAVYLGALNIDLFKQAVNEGIYQKLKDKNLGFGVTMLYVLFRHKYSVTKKPVVGDIIFFDNTYDRNKNKKVDDILTHVGIVINVNEEQTVTFIHAGTSKGIKVSYLNMRKPSVYKKNGKIYNSFLRYRYKWDKKDKRLAAQLVRGFGRLL